MRGVVGMGTSTIFVHENEAELTTFIVGGIGKNV